MKPSRSIRCAIYTRVSTEQGLEQEFNSLDAQREASEAYIQSQAHEGWTCLKDRFDDGGYSGGSMDRPALQDLLAAVRAKKLDVIVVYKVDRLTRSLADFAKLVELFDTHDVSFVSVTQSFNTTSSMGRLTLNVLLSFAQFEREVTGERIRDKIAASKKKGLWMGGTIPYGYRLKNRKLIVDPEEAEKVRQIFVLYLELKSLPRLAKSLAERGMCSRARKFASGEIVGGKPFRTGALSHLLRNRMYLGEVNHRGKSYPGEHAPIVTTDMFTAVQELLSERKNRGSTRHTASRALLGGLIYDDQGNRMTPVHVTKRRIRYRYYQSWVLGHGQKDRAGSVSRVPAGDVEHLVREAVGRRLRVLKAGSPEATDEITRIRSLISKVTIRVRSLDVELKPQRASSIGSTPDSPQNCGETSEPKVISIPWTKPTMIRKKEVLATRGSKNPPMPLKFETRGRIVTSIALGRLWLNQLASGKALGIADLAARYQRSEKSVRSILSLAFLAPDIVQAALDNRLPRGLGVTNLTDLPADWLEQRSMLGFDTETFRTVMRPVG